MTKQLTYCENCACERHIQIKERNADYTFRKEPFQIVEKYAECTVCHEDVYHEETANETLQQLSKLYTSKHSITVDDIKDIRKSTGLTQIQFAKVLNLGEATIKRYESGAALPDGIQLSILKMIKNNPTKIIEFYAEVKEKLNIIDQTLIEEKLSFLEDNLLEKPTYEILQLLYSKHENNIDNGNHKFQPDKLFQMIIYFAQEGVLKTKLMKLLWYADFLMFKRKNISISGTPYWHMDFGPVPVEHDTLLGCATGLNIISIEEEEHETSGYTKMIVKSEHIFNPLLFSIEEIVILKEINDFFTSFGSRAISEFSHAEIGWINTKNEELIPYSYASDLHIG